MTTDEVLTTRLASEYLTTPFAGSPQDLVRYFGAVQSQDYPNAKWGLGQRVQGATDESIERIYNEGKILRTHVMRPTWHFIHPDDISWMLDLTSGRIKRVMEYYNKTLELDAKVFKKTNSIIENHLKANNFATRKELALALEKAGIKASGQRLGHIVGWAELDGIICSGPMRGKQFTYALVTQRAPHAKKLSRDSAIKELTKRYFESHGVATAKDFSWWSGLTMKDAQQGIDDNKLSRDTFGITYLYYFQKADGKIPQRSYLLPNYDEYGIAFQERSHFFDPAYTSLLGLRGNANFQHMVVTNGRGSGTWKKTIKPKGVGIEIKPFVSFGTSEKEQLKEEAERFAEFLALPLQFAVKM